MKKKQDQIIVFKLLKYEIRFPLNFLHDISQFQNFMK